MRRHIVRTLGVMAMAVFTTAAAYSQGFTSGRWGQFWGTWIWQTQAAPGMTLTLPALITFHVDGTVSGVDSAGGIAERNH